MNKNEQNGKKDQFPLLILLIPLTDTQENLNCLLLGFFSHCS